MTAKGGGNDNNNTTTNSNDNNTTLKEQVNALWEQVNMPKEQIKDVIATNQEFLSGLQKIERELDTDCFSLVCILMVSWLAKNLLDDFKNWLWIISWTIWKDACRRHMGRQLGRKRTACRTILALAFCASAIFHCVNSSQQSGDDNDNDKEEQEENDLLSICGILIGTFKETFWLRWNAMGE